MKCEICKHEGPNVTSELSPSTLIFGPFRTQRGLMPTYQNRCPKCEKELAKKLMDTIDTVRGVSGTYTKGPKE